MEKEKKIFLITESIIYILFIIFDLIGMNSSYLKYTGILLCLFYHICKKNRIFSCAFFFTAFADLFLLVLDDHYEIGVTSFIAVQLIYFFYLKKDCKTYINLRIGSFIGILIGFYMTGNISLLNLLTAFYFVNLVFNLLSSLSNPYQKVMSIGLFLFMCCDICVGLFNILSYGKAYEIVAFMMWVFYLPSQVLISLSADMKG